MQINLVKSEEPDGEEKIRPGTKKPKHSIPN
jgi:hypothetical protein